MDYQKHYLMSIPKPYPTHGQLLIYSSQLGFDINKITWKEILAINRGNLLRIYLSHHQNHVPNLKTIVSIFGTLS